MIFVRGNRHCTSRNIAEPSRVDSRRRSLLLLGVIYLGFISLGLPDGSFGVAWPKIYPELDLAVGLAGVVLTVGTLLTATSGFSSGRIIARWGTGPVVLVSGILTASGLLLIANAQGLAGLLLAAVPLGLGAGAVDAGLNGYVARHYSGRHMNWLHACWGVGAMTGPLIMAAMMETGRGWRGGYWLIGGVQFALALIFLATLQWWGQVQERADSGDESRITSRPTLDADSLPGWLSAAIFSQYVGVEMTTGLWAGTIMVAGRGMDAAKAALCVMGFYGAIMGGRILAGFVVERWGARLMISGGLLLALAGAVLFASAQSALFDALALGLMGLGFAPVYPCLMHEVPTRFAPEAVQTMIGRQAGAASLGAAALPALAGAVAQQSLAAVPWFVIGGIIVLALSVRWLDRMTPVKV